MIGAVADLEVSGGPPAGQRHFYGAPPGRRVQNEVVDPEDRQIVRAANDEASRPVDVIALNLSCQVSSPAEMRLLSLERWTTFFAIHWFFATREPSDEVDARLQGGLRWRGRDDQGNTYRGGDYGGGGGNSPHWRKTSWFEPPLDRSASQLTLECESPVDGSPVHMELRLRG